MAEAESSAPALHSKFFRLDRRRLPRVHSEPTKPPGFLGLFALWYRSLPPVLSFSSTHLFVCTSPHKRLFSPSCVSCLFFIVSPHSHARSWPNPLFPFRYCSLAAASLSLCFLFLAFPLLSLVVCSIRPYTYTYPFILVIQLSQRASLSIQHRGVLCNSFLNFSFIPFALHIHDNHVITKTPPR